MQDFFDGRPGLKRQPEGGMAGVLRDYEYFSGFCPGSLRGLRARVAEACDRLDYKGSPIYDEYPDRVALERICRKIAGEIEAEMGIPERLTEKAPGKEPARPAGRAGEELPAGGRIVPFPENGTGSLLRAASPQEDGCVETYELHRDSFPCPSGHPYSGTVVMGNPGTYGPWKEESGRREDWYGPSGSAAPAYEEPGRSLQKCDRAWHEGQESPVSGTVPPGSGQFPGAAGLHTMELDGPEIQKGEGMREGEETLESALSEEQETDKVRAENLGRTKRPGPAGPNPWGPPPDRPWGPPPGRPWGPPPERPWGPPPERPWGPPPGRPWGPPPERPWGPPPERPWGPPPGRPWGPPPERPWGPPPNRPWGPGGVDTSDVAMLFLLEEIQHRRCLRGSCG